jgi:hypothetical protein
MMRRAVFGFVLCALLFAPCAAQDSTAVASPDAVADSVSAPANDGRSPEQRFEDDPYFVKKEYDHKQQVIVGSVVMLCVALAMVAMNNYNPKH